MLAALALLHHPTVSKDLIAFSYGGDLWTVSRNGGEAHRLTSDEGTEADPFFSPDGTMIAFTGEYDGSDDVFVVPATGGVPKRLTTYPGADQVMGWTADGTRVIFRSARANHARGTRLFTIGLDGGWPEQIPLPMAFEG
ncbi:MAG TPA: protease, partial [Dongiaceae bacterium]|nr:protease [Dongiaceae bacterium]